MTGFEAYYVYYIVNNIFFTYKKNPVGMFFSEKNKIRDKCIDYWNQKHVHNDGQLFLLIEKQYTKRELPLVFIDTYLRNDSCHPAKIIQEWNIRDLDKKFNQFSYDAQRWTDLLKYELPKIKRKELKLKNANIITQTIVYDIFGLNKATKNSLEEEVLSRYKLKLKNIGHLLKYYWPNDYQPIKQRNYIKTVILKGE